MGDTSIKNGLHFNYKMASEHESPIKGGAMNSLGRDDNDNVTDIRLILSRISSIEDTLALQLSRVSERLSEFDGETVYGVESDDITDTASSLRGHIFTSLNNIDFMLARNEDLIQRIKTII